MNKNKLNLLINDCINIEKNIDEINKIKEKIKKCNSNKTTKIKFNQNEDEINIFIEIIGKIINIEFKYKFKNCQTNIKEERKYNVTGDNENILTKTGTDYNWTGTICEYDLNEIKEYKWKIKILNSKRKQIIVGVAQSDFDINFLHIILMDSIYFTIMMIHFFFLVHLLIIITKKQI